MCSTLTLLLLLLPLAAAQTPYVVAATAYSAANCLGDACDTIQPDCQSAEFVSRAIAAGGCIPRLNEDSPSVDFCRYVADGSPWQSYDQPGAYDLCWTSSLNVFGSLTGLYDFLVVAGWINSTLVEAGCVAFGDGGLGVWSYVCMGVGPQLVSCHGPSRCADNLADAMTGGTNGILCPPE